MDNLLKTTFTPTYKDSTNLDTRFAEDLQIISKSVSNEVLKGLDQFRKEKVRLENEYGIHGYKLAIAFIKRINVIDSNEGHDSPTNMYRWRSKQLLKKLRTGLAEIGYRNAVVSTMIGAAQYIVKLEPHPHEYNPDFDGTPEEYAKEIEDKSSFYNWSKSLPVSSQYELSRTDRPELSHQLTHKNAHKKLKSLSNNFTESINRKDIREVREEFPKCIDHGNGSKYPLRNFTKSIDDELAESEQIETQEDIQNKFFHYMSLIDMEEAYMNDEFKQKLSTMSHQVETLKSWLPNKIRLPLPRHI